MGFLDRLFGKKQLDVIAPPGAVAPPVAAEQTRHFISCFDAVPAGRDAIRAFENGDRSVAENVFATSTDHGLRWQLARELSDAVTRTGPTGTTPFDTYVDSHVLWRNARGNYHIRCGWDKRGGGTADSVSNDGWDSLVTRCEMAVNDLEEAARLAPDDDVPWALMMNAARGLSDKELGERAFMEAQQRRPNSFGAAFQRVEWLSPRWFGSVEKLLDYARRESERAGTGEIAAVTILAHNDINFYHLAFEEDRDAAAAHRAEAAPEVRDCLKRSVDAPGAPTLYSTTLIRHYGGALLWQVADEDGAKAQLSKVGNVYEGWCWMQNQKAYENVRRRLGLD